MQKLYQIVICQKITICKCSWTSLALCG